MSFKDHFSDHASVYREARPHYPEALFAWLAQLVPPKDLAWDCGCGNGQATVALADHFRRVIGTDPSAPQIANAKPHPNVEYRVEPAEQTSLLDSSIDLVTVAQALHWLDLDRFYAEVRRVLKPQGVVAAWTYADCSVTAAVDALKDRLYVGMLDAYWPPERRLVESGYATLAFPFREIKAEPFAMIASWNAGQFLAYLRSWSASQRYLKANNQDPVSIIEKDIINAWDGPDTVREVYWRLSLRVGRFA